MFLVLYDKIDEVVYKLSSSKYDIRKILNDKDIKAKYSFFIIDEPSVTISKKEVIAYSMDDLIKDKNIIKRIMEYFNDLGGGNGEIRLNDVDQVKEKYDTIISEDYNNFVKAVSKNIEPINYEKIAQMFQTITSGTDPRLRKLFHADFILGQQQDFSKNILDYKYYLARGGNKNDYDRMWFVRSYLNDQYYGGVFLFQSAKDPTMFYMEGIAKSQAIILFELMYPQIKLPSLNELLIPFIENFIISHGGKVLHVHPLTVQYNILVKKYGFLPVIDRKEKNENSARINSSFSIKRVGSGYAVYKKF